MLPEEGAAIDVRASKVETAMECLYALTVNLDHRDLVPVANQLVASYARIAELGMPANAVTAAMVIATLNFYKAFTPSDDLPHVLRAMADMMETNSVIS